MTTLTPAPGSIPQNKDVDFSTISMGNFIEGLSKTTDWVRENTKGKSSDILSLPSAAIIAFPAKTTTKKTPPSIANIRVSYDANEKWRALIESLKEGLYGEDIQNNKLLIEEAFVSLMEIRAQEDAKIIVFGEEKSGNLFSDHLASLIRESLPDPKDATDTEDLIILWNRSIMNLYREIRSVLVNDYGRAIKEWRDTTGITNTERKDFWKIRLASFTHIPEELRKNIEIVFQTYVDHYVATLWNQKGLRDEQKSQEANKSA